MFAVVRGVSGLSQRVLRVVSRGTHVPFGSMTTRYNISHTTVRRHMRHLVSLNIVINSNCRMGPGSLKCEAYACMKVGLRGNSVCGAMITRLNGVPRVMRYRFAANPCAVLAGMCTHSGRRLVSLLGGGVRRVPNMATARALVSLRRDVGGRVPVYPRGWQAAVSFLGRCRLSNLIVNVYAFLVVNLFRPVIIGTRCC